MCSHVDVIAGAQKANSSRNRAPVRGGDAAFVEGIRAVLPDTTVINNVQVWTKCMETLRLFRN